jgi:hypothetical protein
MSVLTVEIPDAIRAALDAAAVREKKSAEQVAGESLARVVQAQQQLDYLAARASRGHRRLRRASGKSSGRARSTERPDLAFEEPIPDISGGGRVLISQKGSRNFA